MPFCPKCGKKVSSEATYCYYCGQSLPRGQPSQETKPVPTSQPVATSQPVPAPPPKPMPEELPLSTSNRSRNIAIAIALIVIVVLVSIIAYAFATGFIGASTTQTQQQGAMMVLTGQIFQNNPDYILATVMNIGTKTLVLTSAYVDNALIPAAQVAFSNPTIAPTANCTITITSTTGTDWANGVSHTVKIVANDGTVLSFVCPPTSPQQGAMSVPIYQVIQNSPDGVIFNVTNTGTRNLTIATVYIDGIQVATILGNLTLPIGNTNTLAVIPQTSQNIVDGAAHTLKVVASDGTVVIISVVYIPLPQQGALSIDTGNVIANGHGGSTITVYVRNTGTKSETLSSVYVDNVLMVASADITITLPGAALAPGGTGTVSVASATLINWANGAAHTIKVVASDGTPVAYSVHS